MWVEVALVPKAIYAVFQSMSATVPLHNAQGDKSQPASLALSFVIKTE